MTPDIANAITYIQQNGVLLVFKVLILVLLGVVIIYNVILAARLKTLNRTLSLTAANASSFIQIVAAFILIASISLFVITLVIV